MRKIIIALCAAAICLSSCGTPDGEYKLTVCAVTDVHGRYFDSLYVAPQQTKSSLSRVSTYIKNARRENPDLILIDNGDHLQGDNAAYYFNYVDTISPHIYGEIADYLGYDAMVVGNHDIEAGHSVYDRLRSELKIPYLAANTIVASGAGPYFDEYTIIKRGGIKVAVIGMTNSNVKSWISPALYAGFDIMPCENVQEIVDRVRAKEQPQVVILSFHSGFGDGQPGNLDNPTSYIAANVKGVDAIICGHDHAPRVQYVDNPAGAVPVVNAGNHARFVSRLDITVSIEKGKVKGKDVKAENIDMDGVESDKDYNEKFAAQFIAVRDFTNKEVCVFTEDMYLEDAFSGPSAWLSLVSAVQFKNTGAQISIVAPHGRNSVVKKGTATFNDMFSIYPYENTIYTIELTGRQLKDYLEYSYDCWINETTPSFNYDSAEGIIYKVHHKKGNGERVEIVSMQDGSPFDMEATYSVAMNSYRAIGGGDLLRNWAKVDVSQPDSYIKEKRGPVRDMLYEYLQEAKVFTPTVTRNWDFTD